ncbi:MAG: AMP-binding protein, partial [Acidiferrobacterales bacterium]|nr:AMP-binding protein [Acidiferrobacterales bacterium]
MNLYEYLLRQVNTRPGQQAIIDYTGGRCRHWQFAELDRAAAGIASMLHRQGLAKGDGILIAHPVSAELYIIVLACFRLGLVAVLPDPHAGWRQFERCCAMYPIKGFIGSPRAHLLRLLSPAIRKIPHKYSVGKHVPGATRLLPTQHTDVIRPVTHCHPQNPALITFTSGSTGVPKAAVRSHGFLQAQHNAVTCNLPLPAGSVDLSLFPVFVLASLASGNTCLLPDVDYKRPGRIDPSQVFEVIRAHPPDQIAASPAVLERLVDYAKQNQILIDGPLRICSGGAPVFPVLLENLAVVFPEAEIVTVYGSTEAEPIAKTSASTLQNVDIQAMRAGKGLLVGKPVPEIELRIISDGSEIIPDHISLEELDRLTQDVGNVGEIIVSGDHVLKRYLKGEGDSETKLHVDQQVWHRTGDAGYLDEIIVVDATLDEEGNPNYRVLQDVLRVAYEELGLFREQVNLINKYGSERERGKRGLIDFFIKVVHQ